MVSSISMGRLEKKSFSRPDEVRTPPNQKIETVSIGGKQVSKVTFKPGWKWSKDTKPIAKTQSCQLHHFGYLEAGKLHTVLDDGTEIDLEPGDVVDIPLGHDGWVVGNKPVVFYDFGSLLK
ncbi:MAG: cupin domain-containing protein [Thaumarchaeota archaeon]|nr:cupin domain-containing protein [Nitrososphaerota archaeon]